MSEPDRTSGAKPLRWVLSTTQDVSDLTLAMRIIEYYKARWNIEEFHNCWMGCTQEMRRYETAEGLKHVAGFNAIMAVRLLQICPAAQETPNNPVEEVAPKDWVKLLKKVRKIKAEKPLTIKQFVRALAGLGGHLGRKLDGEPGSITFWHGFEKLQLIKLGYELD